MEFDPRTGDPEALLAALTKPFQGLSPALDREIAADLATASALNRSMKRALDELFPVVPAGKPAP